LAPIAIVLLVFLVLGGIAVYVITRPPAHAVIVRDASIVAVDADIVVVPVDAGPTRQRPDAGHRDAAVPRLDAPEAPRGTGIITIKYKPGTYANIAIDGNPIPSPVFNHKIAAGRHTITFTDPKSGAVLDNQSVDVGDEQRVEVNQR
jgi:hypothetical protein